MGVINLSLMQSSSDCLFHFVDSLDKIKLILSDKLCGSRCKEILNYSGELTPLYVPMISFCDMQLSTYNNLGTAYGKYGIGLSKKWAIVNKLNPVLYIDKSSTLLDNLIKSFKSSLTTVEIARQIFEKNQNQQIKNKCQRCSCRCFICKIYDGERIKKNTRRKI